MSCSRKIHIFANFLKYLIAFILFGISILISNDVLDQYASKATSFKQYEEELTNTKSISIVVELWPLKKMDYPTSVPYQSYERWELGKDFTLSFGIATYRTAHEIIPLKEDVRDYKLSHNAIGLIRFEKLITTWGNSFKISANIVNTKPPYRAFLQVVFSDKVANESIPSVDITISSEENSYGKTMSDWKDGKTIVISKAQGFYWLEIQPRKTIMMTSQSKCSDVGYYSCFHSELVKQNYDHCPRRCFSISTIGNAMPICKTVEEFQCSHEITKTVKKNSKCLPACHQINYDTETFFQEDLEKPDAKRNVTISYRFWKPTMKVEEEFLVHDFVGMVASIGGTLGLFIGFSFLGGTTFLLNKMENSLEKHFMKKKTGIKKQKIIMVEPFNIQGNAGINHEDVLTRMIQVESKMFALENLVLRREKGMNSRAK